MKLLLDEMYPRQLAEQLRSAGHDVVAVVERSELVGRPDLEVAEWARSEGRVVVTENVADFAALDVNKHAGLLLLNARRWPRTGPGIVRIRVAIHAWLVATRSDEPPTVRWL